MDPLTIVASINAAITLANAAIQAGRDAAPYAQAIYDNLLGDAEITQADLEALQARVDALSAELQAPLPPEA